MEHSSLGGLYPSNEKVLVKPVNKSGRVMVQSKVFGYQLQQFEFDFKQPTDSAGITLDGGVFTVPMKLKPVVQGDLAIMYNIFFFKDAGIMRPDSRYEVTALLEMMKKFPTREIKIHGHTNGNSHGKILSRDKETNNFFSLTGSQQSSGSAIKLSTLRAECIRDYLIENGIDKNRLSIKAWGGKRMIHKPLSEKAKENVRVEVEVVKE
jgi:outer membrane protein OmpA-like peptidoglycan-associated protein